MSLCASCHLDYRGLSEKVAPRPIHTAAAYKKAQAVIDELSVKDELTEDERDYLYTFSLLVGDYEAGRWSASKDHDPIEVLRFLLDENDMSGSDLGRLLGQRQLGPKILNRTRQLSKAHIRALAKHFCVDAGLFLEG